MATNRAIVPISLHKENDKEILEKLASVKNRSEYIRDLILADINKKDTVFSKEQKEEIKDMILRILKEENYTKNSNQTDKLDSNQVDAIANLITM